MEKEKDVFQWFEDKTTRKDKLAILPILLELLKAEQVNELQKQFANKAEKLTNASSFLRMINTSQSSQAAKDANMYYQLAENTKAYIDSK